MNKISYTSRTQRNSFTYVGDDENFDAVISFIITSQTNVIRIQKNIRCKWIQ